MSELYEGNYLCKHKRVQYVAYVGKTDYILEKAECEICMKEFVSIIDASDFEDG